MTILAICQIASELGQLAKNLEKIRALIVEASNEGADLIVFPELCLTGYAFEDEVKLAETVLKAESAAIIGLSELCLSQQTLAVVGFIEQSDLGLFNTAGVFGTIGTLPRYRKVHLPALGVDRFLQRGNLGFPVFELPQFRFGINICYDQRFPESARSVAVQGAQIIIVPTCESQAHQEMNESLVRVRAYENRVFYALANRIGSENGITFSGRSMMVDPYGEILALAGGLEEETIYCEIDPAVADDKTVFSVGGIDEHPPDIFRDRSPESYAALVKSAG